MRTLEELGLNSLVGWPEDISDWFFIGMTDISCNQCAIFRIIVSPKVDSTFPSEFRFLCLSCLGQIRFLDFSMAQQGFLSDKYRFISEDGIEKYSEESLSTFSHIKLRLGGNRGRIQEEPMSNPSKPFSVLSKDLRGSEDAPVPKGYRSISWIRYYEAEAIVHAYKSKADFELKSDSLAPVLKCLYFPDDSDERRKFKANVQAIRINNQNQRVIGWIRLEEARAVVEANHLRKDVDFVHLKFGNGGKVQYFPEELEVAKKYRSTTRLLRAD
jgi:hypothetical protein